ncbi:MAG: C1 family peptidase [Lactobacillus sp.]|nr:C1 family peptidase [Lactobacillus sp.]
MDKELTFKEIKQYQAAYRNTENKVKERASSKSGVRVASYNAAVSNQINRTFSIEVPTDNVTDQKQSGRCWLFAGLNVLRHQFAKKYHVKNFTFSQNHLFFWDRLERANIFLNHIIDTADKPLDDRYVQSYLSSPVSDGGQWHMAISLIRKYGLLPSYAHEESFSANNTATFNGYLNNKMRENALVLRKLVAAGDKAAAMAKKEEFLAEVYRMVAIAFGEPADQFVLEYQDDDGKYHNDGQMSPQDFFKNYFEDDLDDYVVLFNAPDHEYDKLYGLPFEDNVENGSPVRFLNTKIEVLKDAAIKQLQAGETIWFGCDVGKESDRQAGILATDLYATDELFGINTKLNKEERLLTRASGSTHAMTLVGVDLVDGQPTKWKIENSWGTKVGDKGYFVMTDKWFDEYLFKVVVKKQYLPESLVKISEGDATDVAPWDSMA